MTIRVSENSMSIVQFTQDLYLKESVANYYDFNIYLDSIQLMRYIKKLVSSL